MSVRASASAHASAHLYLLPHALCMSHVITHKCINRKFVQGLLGHVQGPREEVQGPQMCARVIDFMALARILYLLKALAPLVVALAPQ